MTNKASDADATPTSVLVAQLYNGGWPSNDPGRVGKPRRTTNESKRSLSH